MATASSSKGTWQMQRSRLDRLGRRFGTWALGFGLVGLHVALFLVAATALTLLDLYRSPDQLTVDDGLRTWGSIVALHALAITVFQIVRWAIQEEQLDPVAPVLDRPASTPLSAQTDVVATAPSNGHATSAWWRDLRGSWRSLMDANDSASVATTAAATTAPSTNGHASNGIHAWPSRDTVAYQPGTWPDLPLDPPLSANGYSGSNGANHAGTTPGQWSWVEAAAASWLTSGESEQPAAPSTPPNPPPPSADDPDSSAPTA